MNRKIVSIIALAFAVSLWAWFAFKEKPGEEQEKRASAEAYVLALTYISDNTVVDSGGRRFGVSFVSDCNAKKLFHDIESVMSNTASLTEARGSLGYPGGSVAVINVPARKLLKMSYLFAARELLFVEEIGEFDGFTGAEKELRLYGNNLRRSFVADFTEMEKYFADSKLIRHLRPFDPVWLRQTLSEKGQQDQGEHLNEGLDTESTRKPDQPSQKR